MTTTDSAPAFTQDQLADWKRYERVRVGGKWNMYDTGARLATGLSGDRYVFVMRNYVALQDAIAKATGEQL